MASTTPTDTRRVEDRTASSSISGHGHYHVGVTQQTVEHPTPTPSERQGPLALGVLLAVGGAVGLAAAVQLILDKLTLLENPDAHLTCDFGARLSCSNVVDTWQAQVFGFPNPIMGVVGFSVVLMVGVLVLAGGRMPEWMWGGFQAGVTFGVVFVHWLIYQSLFEIKFLCPWCMVVWSVMIPIFWYTTLRNLGTWAPQNRAVQGLRNWHALVLILWMLLIAFGAYLRYAS